jgi:imidazolonepropionase-like amidohydrolase
VRRATRHPGAIGAEITRRADGLGIPIVAGSDGESMADFHQEVEVLVREGGLSPLAALAAATSGAAAAIGIEERVGRIAAGLQADLVVLEADPSERIQNVRRVHMSDQEGRHNKRGVRFGLGPWPHFIWPRRTTGCAKRTTIDAGRGVGVVCVR